MTPRPWVDRCRDAFAHFAAKGWRARGHFIMRGQLFWVIGMPMPWQERDADNDNGWRPA